MAQQPFTQPNPHQPIADSSDRTMAMLAHLLGLLTSFVAPLIIWLVSKDDPRRQLSADQGREALNFQITMMIGFIIASLMIFVMIGLFLLPILGLCALIFSILGAVAANKGERYRYPFALRLFH